MKTGLLIIVALASGWFLHDLLQSNSAGAGIGLEAQESMRPRPDFDRLSDKLILSKEGRHFAVNVIGGVPGEILVDLTELQAQDGRIGIYHRKLFQRKASSWEPAWFWIDGQRTVVVTPETSWGGVHKDTGLGVNIEIFEGKPE